MLEGTIEHIRAAACNLWAQGVDGLFLASWYDWPRRATYYEKLREVAHPTVMAAKDKITFIPTDDEAPRRNMGRPHPSDELERWRWEPSTATLPLELAVGAPASAGFMLSDDLARWAAVDRVHVSRTIIAGLSVSHSSQDASDIVA